ncbi:hypothetical protein jhhlp_004089 [Lomentospora prolificans]|uniref:Uncharacterized protein n=1 Tax=Lomentospora prolificans TaxID=41688 RepID=A0A2N3NAK6_9PEZI|nr:hypothetical protein jhhlp_004089 [Lomentospora prolificans]
MSLMTEDQYFSSNPAPKNLARHEALAKSFIDAHATANRRVVLVTSGGTTVPLEKQTVRFIDNFSAGTRGATSAEYFLEAGYAVIFLHRQFSLLPYSRHYSHSTDCFLDFLAEAPGGRVVADESHQERMLDVLRKYQNAKSKNLLLMIPFLTITDYLYELRAIARLMRPLGPSGLLYLAAAVSDFFVPTDRMAEHKIQSTDAADKPKLSCASNSSAPTTTPATADADAKSHPAIHPSSTTTAGAEPTSEEEETFDNFDSSPKVPRSKRLIIDLDPVPKFLKNLVDGWAPEGMIVSFKLETDPSILVHKAAYSLDRYQHHLVIGNLLATRKWEVVFVAPGRPDRWIRVPTDRRTKSVSGIQNLVGKAQKDPCAEDPGDKPMDPSCLPDGEPEVEIESLIIPAVEELHTDHMKASAAKKR